MKPYYQDDFVTLYHGDCLEISDWWANADVLVTDPPYGIGWEQRDYLHTTRTPGDRGRAHEGIKNDGDTSTRDAALALWGERPALVFGAIEAPFPKLSRRVLVWKKPNDAGLFGSIIWRKDWEPIFMCGKWKQSPAKHSSVITTNYGSHRQYAQGVHPHAKPLDILEDLISKCPPGVVADPFAGSGSTLVAAKRLGRRAIGIELEEKYCEIAAQRLSQDVLDLGALTPDPTTTLIV